MLIQRLKTRLHPHRRWLVLGFSTALTLGALFFVFRSVDRATFAQLLVAQNRGLLIAAALFTFLQIILGAERWRAILSAFKDGQSLAMLKVQSVYYSSVFFNCLPFGNLGGDFVRIWLARKFALSIKQLVLSVVLDRIITVGALLILAVATLPSIASPLATTVWFVSAAFLAVGIAGLLLLRPVESLLGRWRHQRLIYSLTQSAEELRFLVRHGGLSSLAYALASAFCAVLTAYCILCSLRIGIEFMQMIAVASVVTFVSALPISLAGWGIREISYVTLLGMLGIDREAALLVSVEIGILATLMSLPGGVIWLSLGEHRQAGLPIK